MRGKEKRLDSLITFGEYSRKHIADLPKVPCRLEHPVDSWRRPLPAMVEQDLPGEAKTAARMPCVAAVPVDLEMLAGIQECIERAIAMQAVN